MLLEDVLAIEPPNLNPAGRNPLTINLNHTVWILTTSPANPAQVTGVQCYHLLAQKQRSYQVKTVVLMGTPARAPSPAGDHPQGFVLGQHVRAASAELGQTSRMSASRAALFMMSSVSASDCGSSTLITTAAGRPFLVMITCPCSRYSRPPLLTAGS
jgi:hypothetical protein